jgi:ribosomal protein S5
MRPRLLLILASALIVALPAGASAEEPSKDQKDSTLPLKADGKDLKDGDKEKKDGDKEKKDGKDELYAQLAQLPAGVCKKELGKDKQGRIQAILVVGRATISTSLGKARGIELAQQRAINSAKIKFMQWLKEDVTVRQGQEDETVILTEGAEEDGKDDAKRESGKAIEKNTTKFETVSKGLVRGLQVVYFEQQGKEKTYVVIMKWSTKNAAEAARIDKELNNPGDKPGDKETKKPTPKRKPEDKTIPDKKGKVPDDD